MTRVNSLFFLNLSACTLLDALFALVVRVPWAFAVAPVSCNHGLCNGQATFSCLLGRCLIAKFCLQSYVLNRVYFFVNFVSRRHIVSLSGCVVYSIHIISNAQEFDTLTYVGNEVETPTGIFGVSLQSSIKYANVAISFMDDRGESSVYGYVPIVVAKCGVFLKEKGKYTSRTRTAWTSS